MLSEAALLRLARRRLPPALRADAVVASAALLLYALGLCRLIVLLAGGSPKWHATLHWSVACLILWTGFRWWRSARALSV
jgi:hypothetical protein